MPRSNKPAACALFLILLSGCMNFMSMRDAETRTLALGDFDKIKSGMTEKEVVAMLGAPTSFGVDDQGREFLHFENWKLARSEASVVMPFVGALSTKTAITGIVVEVFVMEGIVQGKSQYLYQSVDEPKEKEKRKTEGQTN